MSNANRASGELSAGILQSKKGAEVQARKISETASAMEQMSAVVIEVSRNASLGGRNFPPVPARRPRRARTWCWK